MIRFRSVALACVLVAATLPASAGSSAFASISSIKFQLIDLDPDDGVAASFRFMDGQNRTDASHWVDDAAQMSSIVRTSQTLDTWMAPMSGAVVSSGDGAITSWLVTPDTMSVAGVARGLGGQFEGNVSSGPLSDHYWLRNLALSGHAALNIELSYSLDVAAGNAPPCVAEDLCARVLSFNTERSGASVGASLSYSYLEDGLSVSYSRHFGDSIQATAVPRIAVGAYVLDEDLGDIIVNENEIPGVDQSRHSEGKLKFSFINASQQQQTANFQVSAMVWGKGNTPAVPEPHFAFMCIAGLGMIGMRAIRRRAH